MTDLLQFILSGLSRGSIYGMVGIGFALIFRSKSCHQLRSGRVRHDRRDGNGVLPVRRSAAAAGCGGGDPGCGCGRLSASDRGDCARQECVGALDHHHHDRGGHVHPRTCGSDARTEFPLLSFIQRRGSDQYLRRACALAGALGICRLVRRELSRSTCSSGTPSSARRSKPYSPTGRVPRPSASMSAGFSRSAL